MATGGQVTRALRQLEPTIAAVKQLPAGWATWDKAQKMDWLTDKALYVSARVIEMGEPDAALLPEERVAQLRIASTHAIAILRAQIKIDMARLRTQEKADTVRQMIERWEATVREREARQAQKSSSSSD